MPGTKRTIEDVARDLLADIGPEDHELLRRSKFMTLGEYSDARMVRVPVEVMEDFERRGQDTQAMLSVMVNKLGGTLIPNYEPDEGEQLFSIMKPAWEVLEQASKMPLRLAEKPVETREFEGQVPLPPERRPEEETGFHAVVDVPVDVAQAKGAVERLIERLMRRGDGARDR